MEKSSCLGCKTHFTEGEKLPLEGISIELKNYQLPLKQQKHRWNLLKTICSLLNSKGGTIFIGAEDKTGQVKGVSIQRKQQDQFKLFIEQLVSRIQPTVDLHDKEQIIVQFIPVLNNQKFVGKYLVKIAVSQGDPSKLYCFTQKVSMQSAHDKKNEEYEIVYSYRRQNMGCVKEIKGLQLVTEAINKAAKPINAYKTFHEDCNPQPPSMTVDIVKIGFGNIGNKQIRNTLQKWFEHYLQELQIPEFTADYDNQNDILLIDLQNKSEYNKVVGFIEKNLNALNQNILACKFTKADLFLDCMLFRNQNPIKVVKEEKNIKIKAKDPKKPKSYEKIQEQTMYEINTKITHKKQKVQKSEKIEKGGISKNSIEKKQGKDKTKNHICLTFTHINPQAKKQFIYILENGILDCEKRIASQYQNTVEVFFSTQEDLISFYEICLQNQLSAYGFKGQLRKGTNTGCLSIKNYEKSKWNALQKYLKTQIGKDLKEIQSIRNGNKYSLVLAMSSKPAACIWLDKLLKDKNIKQFQIPGASKGNAAKMKIFLEVQNIEQDWQF